VVPAHELDPLDMSHYGNAHRRGFSLPQRFAATST
jgi:hypothetical protein